jgi:hypothetical protein
MFGVRIMAIPNVDGLVRRSRISGFESNANEAIDIYSTGALLLAFPTVDEFLFRVEST